jgi:CDP-diacylglycerol--glycerol-3-phosphate 3-phosphatidyltransferase
MALVWLIAWLAFYARLRPAWPLSEQWLLLSSVVLAYGLWVLWRNLPANHRLDESELLPTLGPGNVLTLARGLCVGLLAGFLFGPWPPGALAWAIVLLYTVADVADYFDGYLARRANHVTGLGGALDIEFDALGTLVVILLAISFGQLPPWYLALGLARYLFIFGLWLRRRLGRPIHEMTPSVHRRIFAGFQMGFLSVVLWPIMPQPMAVIAGAIFGATTGAGFLRDWLVVSGALDPASAAYRRAQRALFRLFAIWLPPLWRALLVVSLIAILRAVWPLLPPGTWRELLAGWRVPVPGILATIAALTAVGGGALVGLGILGRVASIALAVPIGFDIAARGLTQENAVALVCITFLQLFGAGPLSLAPLEERFIVRRLGEA